MLNMPYAAKATIEWEYLTDHLMLYITFRSPMRRSAVPQASPPVYDWYPPLYKWLLEINDTPITVTAEEWLDEYTLLLTSQTYIGDTTLVTLEYDGPDNKLQTTWGKRWEPWGPIVCKDLTANEFKTGMILLWSGSVATVPNGWNICDGTNGTPNLEDKFVVGAGGTKSPGANSATATHTHTVNITGGGSLVAGSQIANVAPAGQFSQGASFSGGGTSAEGGNLPPYYALCYIMKL